MNYGSEQFASTHEIGAILRHQRTVGALLSGVLLLSACGAPNEVPTATYDAESVTIEISQEPLPNKQVVTPLDDEAHIIDLRDPATATKPSDRLQPPTLLDCLGVNVLVFGNSNDMYPNWIEPDLTPYPELLAEMLNNRPDIDNIKVTSVAYPGSTIVEPAPYGLAGDMTRLVTAVPAVFALYSPEELKNTFVIISPSAVSLYNSPNAVAEAVEAVTSTVQFARNAGATVFVKPMDEQTEVSAFLTGIPDINERMIAFNNGIADLLSPSMMRSPVVDTSTGKPNPMYYDDYKAPAGGPMAGSGDGLHFDNDGHTLIAQTLAQQPELDAFLKKACLPANITSSRLALSAAATIKNTPKPATSESSFIAQRNRQTRRRK